MDDYYITTIYHQLSLLDRLMTMLSSSSLPPDSRHVRVPRWSQSKVEAVKGLVLSDSLLTRILRKLLVTITCHQDSGRIESESAKPSLNSKDITYLSNDTF